MHSIVEDQRSQETICSAADVYARCSLGRELTDFAPSSLLNRERDFDPNIASLFRESIR